MISRWRSSMLVGGIAILAMGVAFTTSVAPRPHPPLPEWKNAYWVWRGEAPFRKADRSPLLYVQVQGSRWPTDLPEADEYVIVNRLEPTSALDDDVASQIIQNYKAVLT